MKSAAGLQKSKDNGVKLRTDTAADPLLKVMKRVFMDPLDFSLLTSLKHEILKCASSWQNSRNLRNEEAVLGLQHDVLYVIGSSVRESISREEAVSHVNYFHRVHVDFL